MDGAVGREAYPYGVARGLQSGVGQRSGLVCQGTQLCALGLRHFAGAVEGKGSGEGGCGILLVSDAELDIFLSRFGCRQVNEIPLVGVGILVVAARPVEADGGLAGRPRVLLFQLHLEGKVLISGQTDIDGVVRRGDTVEQVARDEFLVCAAYADVQAALRVGDRVGAVETECRMNGYWGGAEISDADIGLLVKHTQAVHAHFVPNGVAGALLAAFRHIEDHGIKTCIIGLVFHYVLRSGGDFHSLIGGEPNIYLVRSQHAEEAVADGLGKGITGSERAGNGLQVDVGACECHLGGHRSRLAGEVLYRENDILHVGLCLGDINGIPYGGVRLLGMARSPVEVHAVLAGVAFVHMLQTGGEGDRLRGDYLHIDIPVRRADAVYHVLLDGFHKALPCAEGYGLLDDALGGSGHTYLRRDSSLGVAFVGNRYLGHHALATQRIEMNLIDLRAG